MKVLFVAGGRRVSLANRFIQHGFEVHGYETEVDCPLNSVATITEGKKWSDPDIRQHLLETIQELDPDVVLPLSDHATPILSSIVHRGIITASGRTNTICLNKQKFEETFQWHHFYPSVREDKPVIFKPIYGANSKGLQRVSYQEYLKFKDALKTTHVAQELVDGIEISVDAYFNRFSKMIDAVPRQRLEVQGGEVSRSITLARNAFDVESITRQVGEQIGLVGPVCAQYIIDQRQEAKIMEINARFGGGVILSLEAGFDQVQLIKDEWVRKREIIPQQHDWVAGLSMTRYFQEHFHNMTIGE